jgi:tetratricopeptide (TPR) repeat protein
VPIRAEGVFEIFRPAIRFRVLLSLGAAIAWACAAETGSPVSEAPPTPANPPILFLDTVASEPEIPTDSRAVKELLHLAEVERRAGNAEAEYAYLSQVIELDNAHCPAHARLAEITGLAPTNRLPGSNDLVRRALQHPYDPKALVIAAELLVERGSVDQAIEFFERAVWLADLDPAAALIAIRKLYVLSDEWKHRRIVPVQLYVDDLIQLQPSWKFQMRNLWQSASVMLESVLETRFVPIAILPFNASDTPNDLDLIHAAFLAETRPPAEGIYAAVTGRPLPSGNAVYKKGVSELLGRSMTVRIAPGAIRSRVLAHEILHLYGAIHVLEGIDSLMNPTGDSLALDAPNIRIVRSLRNREFGPGDIEQNVLPWIDLGATVAAYRTALSENLILRDAGIKEAMRANDARSDQAEFRVFRATYLDTHLADVARLVAALMLEDGQRVEALRLLDLSSQLYGPSTPRGRASAEKAKLLRESLAAADDSGAE